MTTSTNTYCGVFRSGRGKVETPRSRTMDVKSYLRKIWKRNEVEHTGRETLLDLGFVAPSDIFFQTAYAAFSSHYALTLRPEVLMHLVLCEVATTVNLHPETYRHLFTSAKEGKEKLEVRHDGLLLGNPQSPWAEGLALFRTALREKVSSGLMEHALPGFSTSDWESDAASTVAFMDAAQSFYDYRMMTLCGIPAVRLAGTPIDYQKLFMSVAALSDVFDTHLGPYFASLLPVLKKISDQASGEPPDVEFWSSIYQYKDESGSAKFNGWLSTFVHYLQDPVQKQLIERQEHGNWNAAHGPGKIPINSIPAHLASTPFIWIYGGKELPMRFVGGVLGVDLEDGAVVPRLSYAVLHEQ